MVTQERRPLSAQAIGEVFQNAVGIAEKCQTDPRGLSLSDDDLGRLNDFMEISELLRGACQPGTQEFENWLKVCTLCNEVFFKQDSTLPTGVSSRPL